MISYSGPLTANLRYVFVYFGSFKTPPLLRQIWSGCVVFVVEIIQLIKGFVDSTRRPMRVTDRNLFAAASPIVSESEMCGLNVCVEKFQVHTTNNEIPSKLDVKGIGDSNVMTPNISRAVGRSLETIY